MRPTPRAALLALCLPLACAHAKTSASETEGARAPAPCDSFSLVVLGAGGGLDESNLSAYLLAPCGSSDYIALDAGTVFAGIRAAVRAGAFADLAPPADSGLTLEGWIFRERIRAHLISHAHLDHVAGLVIGSPEDTKKPILGLAPTLERIRDHLFNGKIWANFTQEGEPPAIGTHPIERLEPGREVPIAGTELSVEAWPLAHAGGVSTAFLIRHGRDYALYLGDTGPDAVEKSVALLDLWRRIAPIVKAGELRVLMIECSWPDGQEDAKLFGHLTPAWLSTELHRLAAAVDPGSSAGALAGLPVVVTHIKPTTRSGPPPNSRIEAELTKRNDLGVRLVFPHQGDRLSF